MLSFWEPLLFVFHEHQLGKRKNNHLIAMNTKIRRIEKLDWVEAVIYKKRTTHGGVRSFVNITITYEKRKRNSTYRIMKQRNLKLKWQLNTY